MALKVMSKTVAKDRVITSYPQPYTREGTPYVKLNFTPSVRSMCEKDRASNVGLRMSKVVIVGDMAVGKTSLVNRFCHDVFDKDYKSTIGVDFEVEKFSILGIPFNLQIWDTAGQERFKCIAASYYRGANAIITAFDMTNSFSFQNARQWMADASESAADPLKFLVGCKKDLLGDDGLSEMESQGCSLANEIGAEYWSVSSKTTENVREFFFRLVSLIYEKAVINEMEKSPVRHAQVGSSLINMNKTDYYDSNAPASSSKGKCCP